MKKIVVLGAGYAGVLCAKKLAKVKDAQVTIIDKNPFHTMLTELHEVAAQRVEEDSIRIGLNKVFAGRGVTVAHDNVTAVDYAKKTVKGEHGAYEYDYLVMASGSKPAFFGVPGAKEHSFTLWSYDDAVKLKEHIEGAFRAAAQEPDLNKKKEWLTFVTVGAGFTGVEMAGELAELAPVLCERYELDRSLIKMIDVDMLDRVCAVLPEKLSAKVQRRLEKMNVTVMLRTNIKAVGDDSISYDAGQGVKEIKAKTVIWTAGVEGSDIAYAADGLGAAGRGRIQTDEYLRAANDKNVFVAGDNVFFVPEGEKASVPQMVENAEASAHTIAHNIEAGITGKGEMEKYAPKFHGVMVCVGGRWGAAHVGTAKRKFALPSFFAMFSKHFINIIYFIQVLGWNKIFSYIKHEFFTVRNKRSFLGGHFSNRGPSFLLVPLRVYLGFYWVYEGICKILEGWFKTPSLSGFFNGANAWYEGILSGGSADAAAAATGAAETAADAVASATGAAAGAAASAGQALINLNILGIFRVILINADQVAFKIQASFVDWMMNSLVIPSDGMQMFMQVSIVLLEIAVGLMLMGGCFTTLAGVASLGLQMMFLTSTGLYMSSWWMIFASAAMLFGAGQVLSFDYYIVPWLKKLWKRVPIARKWYIYND